MNFYRGLSLTCRTILKALAVMYLGLLVVGELVILFLYRFEPPVAYGIGLLLGIFSSMGKVILMEKSLKKSMDMGKQGAGSYANLMMIARYGLTIVVLALAAFLRNYIGLFGAIIGVVCLQFGALYAGNKLKGVRIGSDGEATDKPFENLNEWDDEDLDPPKGLLERIDAASRTKPEPAEEPQSPEGEQG